MGVPAVAVQLGREQISQPFGDDMLADGDGVRVPDDPARGVPHVVVQLMDGDGFQPVQDQLGRPHRHGDVPADPAERRQALDLVQEMVVSRVAGEQKELQVGNRHAGIPLGQRRSTVLKGSSHAGPRVGRFEGRDRLADLPLALGCRVEGEAEVLGVDAQQVDVRDEVVHARHRGPQIAHRISTPLRGLVQDAAHPGRAVNH